MKYLVIEPMLADDQHIGFNSGVVKVLAENASAQVLVLAEARQCERIRSELNADQRGRVVLKSLPALPTTSRVAFALALTLNYLRALWLIASSAPDVVMYMTVEYTIFPALSWWFAVRRKNVNVMIHQSTPLTRARGLKRGILARWLRQKNLRFFVPTLSTGQELKDQYETACFTTLRYPLTFQAHARAQKPAGEVVISLIGKQSSLLSEHQIESLVKRVESWSGDTNAASLRLIVATREVPTGHSDRITFVSRTRMSRQDYVDCLASSHFVLFIGDNQQPPRASGVAMDSIAFDAAIVAPLKGAYADLRELTDMDFGYLFDPSLTFDEVLDRFLATHVTQYAHYQAGCRRLRERVANINRMLPSAVAAF